ncbi:MAG: TetR/AcrR family transcriptional regulator [Nocardioides sp.]
MTEKLDGRTARRDRNTEAVLDTVHDMFVEGNFSPAVEEVAARSGVSLRSVYRYFEDTEELLRMAIERRIALVDEFYVLRKLGEGTLQARITALVNHRLVLHGKLWPTARAAVQRAPYSPQIAAQATRRREMLSEQVAAQFAPELEALGASRGAAISACIDVLCEFEAIEFLRSQRGLSVTRTREAMVAGVTALLRS